MWYNNSVRWTVIGSNSERTVRVIGSSGVQGVSIKVMHVALTHDKQDRYLYTLFVRKPFRPERGVKLFCGTAS